MVDAQCRAPILAAGLCGGLIRSMWRHRSNERVVSSALSAIKPLTFDPMGREHLQSIGAIATVSKVMLENISLASVQSMGCAVLVNLSTDVIGNEVLDASNLVLDALLTGMERHSMDVSVQKTATFCLKNLLISETNASALSLPERDTGMLLRRARENFPDVCGQNVSIALQLLTVLPAAPYVCTEGEYSALPQSGGSSLSQTSVFTSTPSNYVGNWHPHLSEASSQVSGVSPEIYDRWSQPTRYLSHVQPGTDEKSLLSSLSSTETSLVNNLHQDCYKFPPEFLLGSSRNSSVGSTLSEGPSSWQLRPATFPQSLVSESMLGEAGYLPQRYPLHHPSPENQVLPYTAASTNNFDESSAASCCSSEEGECGVSNSRLTPQLSGHDASSSSSQSSMGSQLSNVSSSLSVCSLDTLAKWKNQLSYDWLPHLGKHQNGASLPPVPSRLKRQNLAGPQRAQHVRKKVVPHQRQTKQFRCHHRQGQDRSLSELTLAYHLMDSALRHGREGRLETAAEEIEASLKVICPSCHFCCGSDPEPNPGLTRALKCAGYIHALRGKYEQSLQRYAHALEMEKRLLWSLSDGSTEMSVSPTAALDTASTVSTIGTLLMRLGEYDRAEECLRDSLSLKIKAYGHNGLHVGMSSELESLGDLCRSMGAIDEAERFYRVSEGCLRGSGDGRSGEDTPHGRKKDLSRVLLKMGILKGSIGDSKSALIYLKEATSLRRKTCRGRLVAEALCHLGYLHAYTGDLDEATLCYEESLEALWNSEVCGVESDLVASFTSLGVLHLRSGNHLASRNCLEEALDLRRGYPDGGPPQLLGCLNEGSGCIIGNASVDGEGVYAREDGLFRLLLALGEACEACEDYDVAEIHYREAMDCISPDESDGLDLSDVWSRLGHISGLHGNFSAARECYTNAFSMKRSVYGLDAVNEDLAEVLVFLGFAWSTVGDYSTAISKYELSLRMQQSVLGFHVVDSQMARTLNSLGLLHLKRGDFSAAQRCLAEALGMKRHIYDTIEDDAMSIEIARILVNLGDVQMALGSIEDAGRLFDEALMELELIRMWDEGELREVFLETAKIRLKLGEVAGSQGDMASAIEHLSDSLKIGRQYHKPGTSDEVVLIEAQKKLAFAYAVEGDYNSAIEHYEGSLTLMQTTLGEDLETQDFAETLMSLDVLYSKFT